MKKSAAVSMMFSLLIVLLAVIMTTGNASAQSLSSSLGLVTYPSKGQSAQQQSKDASQREKATLICSGFRVHCSIPGAPRVSRE